MAKKNRNPTQTVGSPIPVRERLGQGKALRADIPLKDHADWSPSARDRDPISLLEESNAGRESHLIPIRYGRMVISPFTFFRGAAALMAADLARTPATGVHVQSCGDCHLLNFGAFATPERNIIVDLNDFDETLPAPWEWDLKRLATSFVLACRGNGFKPAAARDAAEAVARTYRTAMRTFSQMRALDIWYSKLDLALYLADIKDKSFRKYALAYLEKRKKKSLTEYYVPRLTTERKARRVFKDEPPLLYHTEAQREKKFLDVVREHFKEYRETLPEHVRVLLDRYTIMDAAMKIVGIGSVGTRCGVLLLMASADDPLILQVKEARQSALEPFTDRSGYKHNGQRVVAGQRLMQAQSDIFLGWTTGLRGHHLYLRQLRDMKVSPMPELWTARRAVEVASSFGWVLARAHARSGDPAVIGGYLGSGSMFDAAIADFAISYADQTELDHKLLVKAIKSGRIEAQIQR